MVRGVSPDMVLFKFTKAMQEGKSIDVYNYRKMKRDFTYIDDIVEALVRVQDVIPQANADWTVESGSPATSSAPYRIYNIGNSSPVELMTTSPLWKKRREWRRRRI